MQASSLAMRTTPANCGRPAFAEVRQGAEIHNYIYIYLHRLFDYSQVSSLKAALNMMRNGMQMIQDALAEALDGLCDAAIHPGSVSCSAVVGLDLPWASRP